MRVNNDNLLDNGPVNLGSAANLQPIWLGHIIHYSIQLKYTGSPAGTFKLQASNDPGSINSSDAANQAPISNWTDVADSTITVAAAGDCMYTVENAGYNWVRVVWTPTSGSGSLTVARAYTKGV